jgi:hypothetical protein
MWLERLLRCRERQHTLLMKGKHSDFTNSEKEEKIMFKAWM